MHQGNYWTRLGTGRLARRRFLTRTGVASGGIATLALLGCGSSSNSNSSKPSGNTAAAPSVAGSPAAGAASRSAASPSSAASTGNAVGATGQPVSGGTFIFIQYRDAASLDPLASQVYTTPERIGLVYPRLLYYDLRTPTSDPADTKQIPSYITKGWEFAGDGQTLTFHLQQGVHYSKTAPVNGRELVAQDVQFSINRYMTDPTSVFKARYTDIDSIQTPDQYTVVFKLKHPSAYVLYALAAEPSFVTPPEVAQQSGDYKEVLVGPGPYLHVKTTQGEGSSFKKNPDYVDAAHIYYDNYEVKVITDHSTYSAAMRTVQADFTDYAAYGKTEIGSLVNGNSAVKSFEVPVISNYGVWFNMNNAKWKDLRARQAISKAFDRQQIITQLMQSDGVFIGPVPVGFGQWAFTDEQMRQVDNYKYDPTAAKQLWSAAGSPSSSIEMYIPPRAITPVQVDEAQLIGQQLKANLGVDVTYTSDEYSTYVNKVYNNKFPDVGVFGMGLYDPMDYLLAQYYTGGPRNGPGLDDKNLDQMLDDMKATLDDAARVQKALAIQKYINEQVLSMAHLPQQHTYGLYNAKLQNFAPNVVRPPGMEWSLTSWKAK